MKRTPLYRVLLEVLAAIAILFALVLIPKPAKDGRLAKKESSISARNLDTQRTEPNVRSSGDSARKGPASRRGNGGTAINWICAVIGVILVFCFWGIIIRILTWFKTGQLGGDGGDGGFFFFGGCGGDADGDGGCGGGCGGCGGCGG